MLPTAAPAWLFVVHLAVATSGCLGFVDGACTTGVSPRVENLPVAAAHHCCIVEYVAAALTMAGLAIEVKDVAGLLLVLVRSRLALRLTLHFRIFLRPLDNGEPAHLTGASHCPGHVISSPLCSTVTAPSLSVALGGPFIGAVELRVPWRLCRGNALEPEGEVLLAEIEDMLVIAAALLGGVVDSGLIAAILILDVKDVIATAALRRQVVQLTATASFLGVVVSLGATQTRATGAFFFIRKTVVLFITHIIRIRQQVVPAIIAYPRDARIFVRS